MANVIIKNSERQSMTNKVLKDFGYNGSNASKQTREYAECVAQKSYEAIKKAEAKR